MLQLEYRTSQNELVTIQLLLQSCSNLLNKQINILIQLPEFVTGTSSRAITMKGLTIKMHFINVHILCQFQQDTGIQIIYLLLCLSTTSQPVLSSLNFPVQISY